jgi:hypothetical protein
MTVELETITYQVLRERVEHVPRVALPCQPVHCKASTATYV